MGEQAAVLAMIAVLLLDSSERAPDAIERGHLLAEFTELFRCSDEPVAGLAAVADGGFTNQLVGKAREHRVVLVLDGGEVDDADGDVRFGDDARALAEPDDVGGVQTALVCLGEAPRGEHGFRGATALDEVEDLGDLFLAHDDLTAGKALLREREEQGLLVVRFARSARDRDLHAYGWRSLGFEGHRFIPTRGPHARYQREMRGLGRVAVTH